MLKNRNDKHIGDHYLAYNKTLRKALKVTKWEFHQEQCREFQQNTKKLWQLINKIRGRTNDKSNSIDCLSVKGVRIYEGEQISNSLARYFATVGKTFAEKIPVPSTSIGDY